jgi:hypothetical protein
LPLAFVVLTALPAQDAPPRSKASDYPAHVSLPGVEIGAEYLLHSIPGEKGFYFAKEYLVVEVGIFPSAGDDIAVSSRQLTLRINHGKSVLLADSPGSVAAALKYPDWETRPNATAKAGPVILGAPPEVGRFPGDPRQAPPVPRPVGEQSDPSGTEKEPPKTIEQSIANAALPEGPANKPAKGCLFFRFTGKTKSIRSLELIYDAGESRPKATIALF